MANAPQAAPGTRVAPITPPPFQMQPLAEHSDWLKMLVHAIPGAGKTTLCASSVDVPAFRDVLFLNIEAGTKSLRSNPRIKESKLIQVVSVQNFSQVDKVKDWLTAHCIYRDKKDMDQLRKLEERITGVLPQEPKQFRTVIVDSIGELDNMCMMNVLGIADNISLDGDVPGTEWAHYKANNTKMQILARRFRDLPMNVLMTCVTKWVQDERKRMHYSPALTGQLKDQVQGFVDIVGYLAIGEPTDTNPAPRRLWVQPVNKSDAKNRWAGYKEAYFEDPTMLSILKAVGLEK